jgi:hypothetical protein
VSNPIIKTKKDKELLAKWNKKLDKYDDCNKEHFYENADVLRTWDKLKFKNINLDKYEDTYNYYTWCREVLETAKFPSALHKKIWKWHAEGLALREIQEKIGNKRAKDAVARYIQEVKDYVRSKTSDTTSRTE